MDAKNKFSEQPTKVKVIYGAVIAVLCITAIIIGIVSVASRKEPVPEDNPNPPVGEGEGEGEGEENPTPEAQTFISPVVGTVSKGHSLEVPVFSNTLGDWRIHTGIDISAEEGADVFATADGTVSRVYNDPFFGKTVEITHAGGIVSRYSNLSADGIAVKEGDEIKSGAKIGKVGDTSISELADESHLHFELRLDGVSVNPLDYISEDSKQASLGITES